MPRLSIVVFFVLTWQVQPLFSQSFQSLGFDEDIIDAVDDEVVKRLVSSLAYLTEKGGDDLEEAEEKAKVLRSALGDEGEEKIDPAELKKYVDRSLLFSDLKEVGEAFGGNLDGSSISAAVHILDLALTVQPNHIDTAYRMEELLVKHELKLLWRDDRSRSVPSDMKKSGKFYEVALSAVSGGDSPGGLPNGLARKQSLVKGLLVQELSGSQFAGEASQMNATVVKQNSGNPLSVRFNQKVGSTMTQAVSDMMSYLKKRHGERLPPGIEVELSFEEQYIPKDGPSAGVACTLMLESLLKGHQYSPQFAVTGALDGEGIVGGVGGVDGKIRGAVARKCEIIAIPSENESVVRDLLILEGAPTLTRIQIFGIGNFEEALRIAKRFDDMDPDAQAAVRAFQETQGVLNARGGMGYLQNPQVQTKLRSVLKTFPNHLSAKYLLLTGMRRAPRGLSLMGSILAIDRNASPLIVALQEGDFNVQDRLAKDSFGKTISALTRLRPQLDNRTRACADAIIAFSGYIRTAVQSPPRSNSARVDLRNNIRNSGRSVDEEYKALFQRPDVRKELMLDEE